MRMSRLMGRRRGRVWCIDQILDGGNKQDAGAVASMIEAALEYVHQELPDIKSVIVQSDNAKCYNCNELRLLTTLINTRSPLKVERHIFTETQDGKGLIDAHFARGTAHCSKFMRTYQRNRIRAIATPKGLAFALAWGGGIRNSSVQIMRIDRAKLTDLHVGFITKPKVALNKLFSRCNDVFYSSVDCAALVTTADMNAAKDSGVQFGFKCFAYSGIGDGSTFSFKAGGSAKLVNDVVDAGLAPDGDIDIGEENEPEATVPVGDGEADFLFGDTDANEDTVIIDEEEEAEDDDEEPDQTVAPDVSYAPVPDTSGMMLTGVRVMKQSKFGRIVGPRDAQRVTRIRICEKKDGRKDMVAAAVRMVLDSIDAHDVDIRDGQGVMKEYELAVNTVTKARSRGWARRAPHGQQYGVKYLPMYMGDITALFKKGVKETTAKLGPAQMHEALKRKYPGRYSMPSESEIRSAIGGLVAAQKSKKNEGDDDDEGGDDADTATATGQRGRKSKLPKLIQEHLEQLACDANLKPAAACASVREKFGTEIEATDKSRVTDPQLKVKFNVLKSGKGKFVL
jgi:hypothetical protein